MKALLYAMLAIAATAGCSSQESDVLEEDEPGLLAQTAVAPDSAKAIALARVPGGRITKAELEREGGTLIYSFDIRVAGTKGITEIHVDARTGAILAVEKE